MTGKKKEWIILQLKSKYMDISLNIFEKYGDSQSHIINLLVNRDKTEESYIQRAGDD